MPNDHKALADLKKCMRDCDGDTACMDACQLEFEKAGGTVKAAPGGKVFIGPDGEEWFLAKGGKVF